MEDCDIHFAMASLVRAGELAHCKVLYYFIWHYFMLLFVLLCIWSMTVLFSLTSLWVSLIVWPAVSGLVCGSLMFIYPCVILVAYYCLTSWTLWYYLFNNLRMITNISWDTIDLWVILYCLSLSVFQLFDIVVVCFHKVFDYVGLVTATVSACLASSLSQTTNTMKFVKEVQIPWTSFLWQAK